MKTAYSYILKFLKLRFREKVLFLEALVMLFTTKIMLLLFPLKYCLNWITYKKDLEKKGSQEYLQSLKRASHRANIFAFWKNVCLVQSVAARLMLNRRNIRSQLSIGVAHDEHKKVKAHAWLSVGEVNIVPENSGFLKMYSLD